MLKKRKKKKKELVYKKISQGLAEIDPYWI